MILLMIRALLPDDLLEAVEPRQLGEYARSTGWRLIVDSSLRPGIAVYDSPDEDLAQVLVPLKTTFVDYARRIADAVHVLAEKEYRPELDVLYDLLRVDADVVRFRIVSTEVVRGELPLEEAVDLLAGARQALLSAACSVVAPSTYHRRLSRGQAEQMIATCRLGQTERGSFTVAIVCPLYSVAAGESSSGDAGPFPRRVTRLLIKSAARIVRSIESDAVSSLFDSSESDEEPVVSSNLCDALLRMRPPQERSSLMVSCAWTPSVPLRAQDSIPREVTFRQEHFPVLETIYQRLKPAEEPKSDLFVGYVDAMKGEPGDDSRVQGEVTLQLLREGAPLYARVDLGADEYRVANEAHMTGGMVAVRGILHRGRRVHRITDIESFHRIEGEAGPRRSGGRT